MAKKQIQTAPEVVTGAKAAAAKKITKPAATASATKAAPRVPAAKHSRAKCAVVEVPVAEQEAVKKPVAKKVKALKPAEPAVTVAAPVAENPHEAIAKIAYGYYVARGYQPGDPAADWFRAESEYYSR